MTFRRLRTTSVPTLQFAPHTGRSKHTGILHQQSSTHPPTFSALKYYPHYFSPQSPVHTLRYSPPTIQFIPPHPLCNSSVPTLPFSPQSCRSTHCGILHQQSRLHPPTLSALQQWPHYASPNGKVGTHTPVLSTIKPVHTLPPSLQYISAHTTLRLTVRSTNCGILNQQSSSFPPTLSAPHLCPHYLSPHGTVGQHTPVFSTNNPVHSIPPSLHHIITHTTLRPTVRPTHSCIFYQQTSSHPTTLSALHQCAH